MFIIKSSAVSNSFDLNDDKMHAFSCLSENINRGPVSVCPQLLLGRETQATHQFYVIM